MTGNTVLDISALIVAISAACGGLFVLVVKPIRILARILGRVDEIADDWNGTPARPGVEARPGVMERLKAIEAQLLPNGGASTRDAINRVERTVARLEEQFVEHLRSQED
ncbi:hypothetical protein [Nonomuraea bangladeshensis]|uniref:hypothetical protein n=1 Tax=Nonomuraea bangladeshensis TaxID=404385 RepID=UPI003C2CD549